MVATAWTFRRATPGRVDRLFRRLQLLSAAAYSLGHGTNDAQKTMGIIAVLLFSRGHLGPQFYVPFWVVLAAHAAMGLGTLSGGWRIVKTMGMRITKLPTGWRVLRRNGRRHHPHRHGPRGQSGQGHPYPHRSNHRGPVSS